jgi:hypothetical protein
MAMSKRSDDYSPIQDLYTTVKFIASECLIGDAIGKMGDERLGLLRSVIKHCHRKQPKELKQAVLDFNAALKQFRVEEKVCKELDAGAASPPFVEHILEQAYARCVAPKSNLLREYEGFSNNVYGEIKPMFVREIIKAAGLKETDCFLDMGSGTGNVVLQVAAECLCESYGIEIMENPASLAKKQRNEFVVRMRYYGKPVGRIYLKQGDFLAENSIQEVITKSDVIFVNK